MQPENYPHHDNYSSLNIILNSDKLYDNVSCRIKLLARHGNTFKCRAAKAAAHGHRHSRGYRRRAVVISVAR